MNHIQTLDPRKLFAASVANGVLFVNGTDGNDHIAVQYIVPVGGPAERVAPYYDVNINGKHSTFFASGIKHIEVYGKAGNDLLNMGGQFPIFTGTIFPFNNPVNIPTRIYAGSGNDTVYGGTKGDAIFGQDGNDELYGINGNDFISGGKGNDLIGKYSSEQGNDTILGGDGNDTINAGYGNDKVDGGAGNDDLTGYDGMDTVTGGPGKDTFYKKLDPTPQILDFTKDDLDKGGEILPLPL